jgi:hypothetical protein
MDEKGARQRFEFVQEEEGDSARQGFKRKIALRQEQSFIVLGKQELQDLADIPTPYLIDELHTRGVLESPAKMLQEHVEKILELIGGTDDAWYRLRNLVFLAGKEKWGNTEQTAKMLDVTWHSANNAMREATNPYRKGMQKAKKLRLLEHKDQDKNREVSDGDD